MQLADRVRSLRPDQWRKIIFTFLIIAAAGYVLFKYVLVSEQERARRMVYKGARAVEAQSVLRCSDLIAVTYADPAGLNKNSLVRAAARVFQEFQAVDVEIEELNFDIPPRPVEEIEEPQMEAVVRVRMSVVLGNEEGRAEIIDEDPASGQFVLLALVKRKGRWQLQRMEFINVDIMQRYSGALAQ